MKTVPATYRLSGNSKGFTLIETLIAIAIFSIGILALGSMQLWSVKNTTTGNITTQASMLATIHGICQVAGVLTILPFSDFLGRKKTILISNAVITGCLAVILLAGNSWMVLSIFVGILALFYGATFPIYGACAGDYFPREAMGTVIGAWTPFYGLGAILTHWVTGVLRDTTGVYNQAFIINVIMAAVAIVLMSRVRKKRSFEI